jgi:peptidyl-tRNA hydrolase, PTH1 family
MNKFLIAGLGNIGVEYADTRHNIGFNVVDALAGKLGESFQSSRLADVCRMKLKGRQIIAIKPTTYMNLSGKAVRYWLTEENIPVSNLLVVMDDLALPFGTLRLKPKGSDGGHNGLKDIQAQLATQDYCRLRFGIGSDFPKGRQSDFVLGKWSHDENEKLTERINMAVHMIESFVLAGPAITMTQFNNK